MPCISISDHWDSFSSTRLKAKSIRRQIRHDWGSGLSVNFRISSFCYLDIYWLLFCLLTYSVCKTRCIMSCVLWKVHPELIMSPGLSLCTECIKSCVTWKKKKKKKSLLGYALRYVRFSELGSTRVKKRWYHSFFCKSTVWRLQYYIYAV